MKLQKKENVDIITTIRFTEKEILKIKKIAKKNKLNFSETVRGIINKNLPLDKI